MIKDGYFVIKNIGDLLEPIFDISKTDKPCGLLIGNELITREKEGRRIYTRLWSKTGEKEWEEEAKVRNPYYIAAAKELDAKVDGATYYEITDDKFTKMEGRE